MTFNTMESPHIGTYDIATRLHLVRDVVQQSWHTCTSNSAMAFLQQALDYCVTLADASLPERWTSMRSLALSTLTALSYALPSNIETARLTSYHDNVGVLEHVNPLIGTSGLSPNGNGGMIPSVSPPFGMTRWTPQTRENFISQCPYSNMDSHIHGFQATHQPAIWMGDSGFVVLQPGVGEVKPLFEQRAHAFVKAGEVSTPYVYEVEMAARAVTAGENATESLYSPVPGGGQDVPDEVREGTNGKSRRDLVVSDVNVSGSTSMTDESCGDCKQDTYYDESFKVAMTASAHVGHLRVDFPLHGRHTDDGSLKTPHVFIQATRQNWTGHITIDPDKQEISGSNPQRQDYALGPSRAPGFSGYFVSRFSKPFRSHGITYGGELVPNVTVGRGEHLGAWVGFDDDTSRVEVRTGVSFVSTDQARRNIDIEAPASVSFDEAMAMLKRAWLEKLGRVTIEGINATDSEHDQRTIFYTGLFHALQYPSDFSEPLEKIEGGRRTWYEGYTDSVDEEEDSYYQSWSIWDTFRAEHSLLTFFAPERVNSMIRSLLRIYDYSGRLPMWANIVETNIMIGTHVDAVLANALSRNFTSFNVSKAWEAVRKNAYVPPENDTTLLYYDREPYTPLEVRAGLTSYLEEGYVANDNWAEAGSRTLDYAFDDHAASIVASHANATGEAAHLHSRSQSYRNIFNSRTTFMQSRNANGTFASPSSGWTEGDAWIYTFAVPHDPTGLASLFGSRAALVAKLDEYFVGGHNDHTNEPSHHAPYLYPALGYASRTQELVRAIAWDEYNATAAGLNGNEDLGQMSAWYVFSALGFYPLDPAGEEYIVGSPFFEKVVIRLPAGVGREGEEREVEISAPGAATGKPYVAGLKVDGEEIGDTVLRHSQIVRAGRIEFAMSGEPSSWGSMGGE